MPKTCKLHKNGEYIAICSYPLCNEPRLSCLKCMVSKHTSHSNYQLLLQELHEINFDEKQIPTNWTNILGNMGNEVQEIVKICQKNTEVVNYYQSGLTDELKKIDDIFDTFQMEILEKLNTIRQKVKDICEKKNTTTINRLQSLVTKLKQILSPHDLLSMIKNYIDGEQIDMDDKENCQSMANKANSYDEDDIDKEMDNISFDEKLQIYFSKKRVTEEDQEFIQNQFNFLTKNNKSEQLLQRNPINLTALHEIREQFMNLLENSTNFAEIFFPDTKLYDYENLEKVRVYTSTYDEITKIPGQICQIDEIDNQDFLVLRDNQIIEVWDIQNHLCKQSIKLLGHICQVSCLKQAHGLYFMYYMRSTNSLYLYDLKSRKIIKNFPIMDNLFIKNYKVLSVTNNEKVISGPILITILLDNGEIRILNFDNGQIMDLKNKPAAHMCYFINKKQSLNQNLF